MKNVLSFIIYGGLSFAAWVCAHQEFTGGVIIFCTVLIAQVIRDEMQEFRDQLKGGRHE